MTVCARSIAQSWYEIEVAGEGWYPVRLAVAEDGAGYTLCLGSDVSVHFRTTEELQATLPQFGAEHERGYEEARRSLIGQFYNSTCARSSPM